MPLSWRFFALTLTAAVTLAPVEAVAQCLPFLCNFTEKGSKGPYIAKEVKPEKLVVADTTIAKARVEGVLAAGSIDRGELYGMGLSMPKTELALERMIDSFRPHWSHRQPGPVDVKIVANYSFSPQAHTDNVVVVPLGMLIKATNDDQVAWLMAHEFSHLALGHFSRQAKARKREKLLGTAVSLLQGGAVAVNSRYRFNNGKVTSQIADQKEAERVATGIFFRSENLRDLLSLVNQFFSRSQEDQADVAGIDLAYAAGFSDGGASEAIAELGKEDAARKNLFVAIGDDLAGYAKIEGMRTLAAATESGASLEKQGGSFLDNILGNLGAIGIKKLTEHYSATHRPTDARRQGVSRYFERAYPQGESRNASVARLTALRADPEYRDGKLVVDAITQARELMGRGDMQAAVDALKPAMRSRYSQAAVFLNVAAQAYAGAGQLPQAEKYYTTAMQKVNTADNLYLAQSLTGFKEHVDLLLHMGNARRAEEVIGVAAKRFGDDQAFLPQRLRIAVKRRSGEQIIAVMAQCTATADPGLMSACEAELGGPDTNALYDQLTPLEKQKVDQARAMVRQSSQTSSFWDTLSKGLGGGEQD